MGMQDRDWYRDYLKEKDKAGKAGFELPPFQKPKTRFLDAPFVQVLVWVVLLGVLWALFKRFPMR
jgi:hypothetical protein